ncbi:hypothetical protein SAMN05443287_109189 [Micromonospora phaseoli]|uniref:Uncharacterized protein n=1 Tax=Micromonospora phaseoli TaxID=1144548 RepID=A0A1H7CGK5_9ACTN|nr:hypothetical protein [Micromonospora phaseoli]PZV97803.1 hypothetical protein CLV64_10565 [Micromonospora phaseoli]GIJ78461.1 hypothetical protein Xph01_28930 [Micromonospora phaseoli]SEJ88829.1 hypothetical protein SAMN05443287_109189 [Micromonospora phaseoli]
MILGISLGHRTLREAEDWLDRHVGPLAGPNLVTCTHLVAAPYPHVALSVATPEPDRLAGLPSTPPELHDAAIQAASEHTARRSGRAVRFPGAERLVGTLTVGDLLATSAIERVVVLGGASAAPDTPVHTRDFVRPQWQAGELVLVTVPHHSTGLAPFEVPDPTPCCADH